MYKYDAFGRKYFESGPSLVGEDTTKRLRAKGQA